MMVETVQDKKIAKTTPKTVVSKPVHLSHAAQRAEDIAYTINHALACTATDLIDPYIGNITQEHLNKRISIGCGHDHSTVVWWHGVVGELAGDFGAVPVTVAVQRYLPGVMDIIRYVAEPIMGDMFRHGAKSAAKNDAHKAMMAGYPLSKEAYKEHAKAMYQYEIQHVPQGLFWTGLAAVANVEIQKGVLHSTSPRPHIWEGKIKGAAISAGMLFGFRGVATEQANKWDHWSTKHVFMPATKKVGGLFGVKEEDVQRLADKQDRLNQPDWAKRATENKAAETGAGIGH